jgi:hypothetical protein
VPIAAQQGGVPIGDRASSKDGNLHETSLQISLLRYRGSRSFSARDTAMSSLLADSNSIVQVAIERWNFEGQKTRSTRGQVRAKNRL